MSPTEAETIESARALLRRLLFDREPYQPTSGMGAWAMEPREPMVTCRACGTRFELMFEGAHYCHGVRTLMSLETMR